MLLRQEPQSRPVSTTHARTEIQAVFEHIAQLNLWQSKQTLSGPGSSAEATTSLRKWLGSCFEQYNIKRVVDVCGGANWQHLIPGIENIDYCGIDISPTVLRKARVRHDDKPFMSFKELDIVTDELPRADCFLLKDVLQHLPLELGCRALANVRDSGAPYVLVTSFPASSGGRNVNKRAGHFFKNDVTQPPFSLPEPLASVPQFESTYHKHGSHLYLYPNPDFHRSGEAS